MQAARRSFCALLAAMLFCIPAMAEGAAAGPAEAAEAQVPTTAVSLTAEVPVSQTEANINGRQVLTKVFEVSPDTDPDTLVETGLVIGGYEYTLSGRTKEAMTNERTMQVSEEKTVALSSSNSNDAYLEALKTLEQTIAYDKDGYEGELTLVASTIAVSETGRSQQKASDVKTKTYTFAYNDDSLIPATITVGGKTYKKQSASWSDGAYGADGVMPENYIATVRYGRSWTYSSVDGYQATATYMGDVSAKNTDMVRYTVEYIGTPVAGTAAKASLFGGSVNPDGTVNPGTVSGGSVAAGVMFVLLAFLVLLFVFFVVSGRISLNFRKPALSDGTSGSLSEQAADGGDAGDAGADA